MKNPFKKIDSRQLTIYILVVILFSLGLWFIISNSVFLIKNLNQAFESESVANQEITKFDKEGFQKLNLLKER